jgi:hypothetical protein
MGTPTTASYRATPPQRTELLHHLLVRASAGLVAYRHDGRVGTVFVDGEADVMPYTLGVSVFHAYGWLHWWRDAPRPGEPETWWCCHLTAAGEAVLADWDAQVRRAAAA